MKIQSPDTNGVAYLKCEHCNGGKTMVTRPVPAVVLPTLICSACRKNAFGDVVPVITEPSR
ncbi:hypothetical protein D3C85_765180 [compost metagenome]